MNKKRVIYIANHYRWPELPGGSRSWHQVNSLSEKFFVDIIVPRIDPLTGLDLRNEKLPHSTRNTSIKLSYCLNIKRSSLLGKMMYQISAVIGIFIASCKLKKPDIIIAMSAPPINGFIGYLSSVYHSVPYVLDIRDIPIETAIEIGFIKSKILIKVGLMLEKIALKNAAKLFCVSENMSEIVQGKGVSKERISINYIGYDNPKLTTSSHKSLIRRGLIDNLDYRTDIVVFYAGTLAELMDVSVIIKSAYILKNEPRIGFVIVGDGPKKKQYIETSKKESLNVYFTGKVGKNEVHNLCIASDVCVYPSKGGSAVGAMLGNKIFDYLGSAKPVIYVGPIGAVSDLIIKLNAGVVLNQGDYTMLSNSIRDVLLHKKKYENIGKEVYGKIIDKYTAQHSSNSLTSSIFKILSDQ